MANNKELLEMLEKHQQLELRNINICKEREEQLKNPGAKLMLYQIRMDSTKHAHTLQTLMDIIKEGTPENLWEYKIDRYMGQVVTEDELKNHAELEKEMIQSLKETIKKIDEPSTKKILQGIIEDEQRHHKIIMDMIQWLHDLGP